jgi:hypothetical protein
MSGKDDTTRQTAPGGAADATETAGALPVPQTQPEPAAAGRRSHVVKLANVDNLADNLGGQLSGQLNMPTAPLSERGPRKTPGTLDRSLQQRIGAILRDSFTDIEREPLPEQLTKLMEALRALEQRQ